MLFAYVVQGDYFFDFFFLKSKRIIPTIIEIKFNISLAIAPTEPLKQLYESQSGEEISPKRLTIFDVPKRIATVAVIIAKTGSASMMKLPSVGSVPKTKNVNG